MRDASVRQSLLTSKSTGGHDRTLGLDNGKLIILLS